jgi:rod shape-determining protein MreC
MALMALPGGWTQAPRLLVPAAVGPLGAPAASAGAWASRAKGGGASVDELVREIEFLKSKDLQNQADLAKYRDQIAALTNVRRVVKEPNRTFLPANVVLAVDTSMWRKTFVISAGTRRGVRKGMPVLWHNHLIGLVAAEGPWASRVALITDPKVTVGAMAVARGAETAPLPRRDLCVLEGTGAPAASLKWASPDATAGEGATVVTCADPNRGIPEGLLLGRVTGVSRVKGPFACPQVQPFVDIRGVDSVLVLMKTEEGP